MSAPTIDASSKEALITEYLNKVEAEDPRNQNEFTFLLPENSVAQDKEEVVVTQISLNAALGYARFQYIFGTCLGIGIGCEKNQKEAVNWYRQAALQGNARAQNSLGNCLRFGIGCKQNEEEAVTWYREAADQESYLAQYNLGLCLENGIGVKRNISESIFWYCRSALNPENDARFRINPRFKLEESEDNTPLDKDEIIEVVRGLDLCNKIGPDESDTIRDLIQFSLLEKTITEAELEEINKVLQAFEAAAAKPPSPSAAKNLERKTQRYNGGASFHLKDEDGMEEAATLDLGVMPPKSPRVSISQPTVESSPTAGNTLKR